MDNNAQASKIRIGDLLVTAGYITEAQLKEALAIQKESQGKRVGEVLQDLGYATEKQILTALADRLGTLFAEASQLCYLFFHLAHSFVAVLDVR